MTNYLLLATYYLPLTAYYLLPTPFLPHKVRVTDALLTTHLSPRTAYRLPPTHPNPPNIHCIRGPGQVKRMLAHVGGHVGRLHRDRFGSLADHTLLPGAMRPLTREELHSLVST